VEIRWLPGTLFFGGVMQASFRGKQRGIVWVSGLLVMSSALCVVACGSRQQPITSPAFANWRGLNQDERDLALARGREFRGEDDGEIHRLEHVYRPGDPRVHPKSDAALFVLSGKEIVHLEGHTHRLHSGDSIDIPHGQCYATRPEGRSTSSLFFVFWEPEEQAEETALAPATSPPEPR
jgi:mannose-6-phosphate isomerase-like protein (cupin superfamily)